MASRSGSSFSLHAPFLRGAGPGTGPRYWNATGTDPACLSRGGQADYGSRPARSYLISCAYSRARAVLDPATSSQWPLLADPTRCSNPLLFRIARLLSIDVVLIPVAVAIARLDRGTGLLCIMDSPFEG